jgi:DNA-binding HxlR family transcriptional regulator
MLTNFLKHLEKDHLIREAFAEISSRVEYSLTEMEKSLMPAIQQMIDWAQEHFDELTNENPQKKEGDLFSARTPSGVFRMI